MKIQILDRAKKKKIVEEIKPLGIKKVNELVDKIMDMRMIHVLSSTNCTRKR